jgi:MFS family permease
LTKQADELKNLSDKIEELTSKVKELSTNFSHEKKASKVANWRMFWTGAVLGSLIGILGGLVNSYLTKLDDFGSTPWYGYLVALALTSFVFGVVLFAMWKLSKLPPKEFQKKK